MYKAMAECMTGKASAARMPWDDVGGGTYTVHEVTCRGYDMGTWIPTPGRYGMSHMAEWAAFRVCVAMDDPLIESYPPGAARLLAACQLTYNDPGPPVPYISKMVCPVLAVIGLAFQAEGDPKIAWDDSRLSHDFLAMEKANAVPESLWISYWFWRAIRADRVRVRWRIGDIEGPDFDTRLMFFTLELGGELPYEPRIAGLGAPGLLGRGGCCGCS